MRSLMSMRGEIHCCSFRHIRCHLSPHHIGLRPFERYGKRFRTAWTRNARSSNEASDPRARVARISFEPGPRSRDALAPYESHRRTFASACTRTLGTELNHEQRNDA